MPFHFTFRQLEESKDVRMLVNFIASQQLGYPRYDEWVQKTEAEISSGQKSAVLALSDGVLVGDLIYQGHRSLPGFLELKNFRVHPRFRVREFGRFMLRQVEVEGRSSYMAVICDVRPERKDVVSFLTSCSYTPVIQGPLYDSNVPDVSFIKPLRKSREPEVLVVSRNYLQGKLL